MATNDFLQAETRDRRRVAIVAGVAALLTIAAPFAVQAAVGKSDNTLTQVLQQSDHRNAVIAGAVASMLSVFGMVFALDLLLRATRSRDAQAIKPYVRPLLLAGGIAAAIFALVSQVVIVSRLHHWATDSTLTWEELTETANFAVVSFAGLAIRLAFGVAFVMVCLNAMRVGLLTRFLGYLGVISAVLYVIPNQFLPGPIVQAFWLANLAFMLWSVGSPRDPPAWAAGEPVPWPSSAEMREQRVRAAEARRGGGPAPEQDVDDTAAADAASGEQETVDAVGTSGARRKRKKRR
jgi:hypothetical protein